MMDAAAKAKYEAYQKFTVDDAIVYATEHNCLEGLVAILEKERTYTDKNGNEKVGNITWIEAKKEFCTKYYPELMPESKKNVSAALVKARAALAKQQQK